MGAPPEFATQFVLFPCTWQAHNTQTDGRTIATHKEHNTDTTEPLMRTGWSRSEFALPTCALCHT